MFNQLSDKEITYGERWVYSAGFNVDTSFINKERLIEEIDDIKRLIGSGASLSILSHQGDHNKKNTKHLDYLIPFLKKKLKTNVKYFPENNTNSSIEYSKSLQPGEIAIFGNTRFHKGEQENELKLAKQFSLLGDYVAIGGFSKSHRENASNVGITNFVPAYLTTGINKQIKMLNQWIDSSKKAQSVAVLGGEKKEKITIGLMNLIINYDYVIPGGSVLNTILDYLGIPISISLKYNDSRENISKLKKLLNNKSLFSKILLPEKLVIVDKNFKNIKYIYLTDLNKIEDEDFRIVDFFISTSTKLILNKISTNKGNFLMAGPPSYCKKGFNNGTKEVIEYFNNNYSSSILLGGDTSTEIASKALKSSGGGAALQYICYKKLPILEALKKNKKRFNN